MPIASLTPWLSLTGATGVVVALFAHWRGRRARREARRELQFRRWMKRMGDEE